MDASLRRVFPPPAARRPRPSAPAARRDSIQARIAAAKRKAIAMGIATAENADRILYGMSLADFKRDFGEFRVSRAFFH